MEDLLDPLVRSVDEGLGVIIEGVVCWITGKLVEIAGSPVIEDGKVAELVGSITSSWSFTSSWSSSKSSASSLSNSFERESIKNI